MNTMPEEWIVKTLEEIADFGSGGTPSRSKPAYWENGIIPWLKSGELNDSDIYVTEEKIAEIGLKNSSAKIFTSGTLLFALYGKGTVSKTGLLKIDAATNQAILAIIPKGHAFDPKFMQYYLINSRTKLLNQFTNPSSDMGRTNIYTSSLKLFSVTLPPLPEQKSISEILSSVDDAISLVERERRAVERLKVGVMKKLFDGEGWEKVKLSELVDFEKGKKPNIMFSEQRPGYLPYLSTDYLREGNETKFVNSSEDVVLVDDGDLVLLWDGSNAGEFFEGKKGVLSTTMVKFELKTEVDKKYLFYFLKTKQGFIQSQTNGTGIPHVDRKVLLNQDVVLPSLYEQKNIVEILSALDKKLSIQSTQKQKLERIKQGLMNDLLTGKKRVKL